MHSLARNAPARVRDLLTTTADGPHRRDAVLVGSFSLLALLEGALRTDLTLPVATTTVTIGMLVALPWRRRHPVPVALWVTLLGVVAGNAMDALGHEAPLMAATAALLTVPYCVFRYEVDPMRAVGAVILGLGVGFTLGRDVGPVDVLVGGAVVLTTMMLGALVRERVAARARQLEVARAAEREALARDLHDTVAHHVTGIAIRAQVAGAMPEQREQVARSLEIIEQEAQTVLAEMRTLVQSLREEPGDADSAPAPGIAQIASLADPGPPEVTVELPPLHDQEMPEVLGTSLFRIAQEAVTNARRHAHGARLIEVSVRREDHRVVLEVRDDGSDGEQAGSRGAATGGFGLVGIRERVSQLGGAAAAGPGAGGGWAVRAELPLAAGSTR